MTQIINNAASTTPIRKANISGSVFNDIDGLTNNMIDGTGFNNPASTQLYVSALDNNSNIIATVPVNPNGTYSFSGLTLDAQTLVLHTTAGGSTTPSIPTGWAYTAEGTTLTGDGTPNGMIPITLTGSVYTANFGVQQTPTPGAVDLAGTVIANEVQGTRYNPGVIDVFTVPSAAFGATDPDGGIVTNILITDFSADLLSITVGVTTYYKAVDKPATCVMPSCAELPAAGITVPTNALGIPTTAVKVTPKDGFLDGNTTLTYKAQDNADANSASSAVLTIPFVALKYTTTGGWENGTGNSGRPGTGDGDKTLFWVNTPNTPAMVMDVPAVVKNLIVYSGTEAQISSCLTVNDAVKVDGTVRLLAISDQEFGQYLGPEMPKTTVEMVLEEGWHNIGFPVSGEEGVAFTASDFASQNNSTAHPRVVQLESTIEKSNLHWYDPYTSGGKEEGFFIKRNAFNPLDLGEADTYKTHAYGTWNATDAATDLGSRGFNFFVNKTFMPTVPYTISATGTTNDKPRTFATHNNFGGWNLIPNIYPVTISALEMYNDGFFGTDLDKVIYIWNPGDNYNNPLPGNFASGAYVAIDAQTGVGIGNANTIQQGQMFVAPMQSFYVRRTSASTVRRKDGTTLDAYAPNPSVAVGVTVDDAVTTPSSIGVTIKPAYCSSCSSISHYKREWDVILLTAQDEATGSSDATELVFDYAFTNGIDAGYDIQKMGGNPNGPILFTVIDNQSLVINKMVYPEDHTKVPVGFYTQKKEYRIDAPRVPAGWMVYLEDKLTGNWHDLNTGSYSFKNDVNFRIDRFVLHFNKTGTPIARVQPEVNGWSSSEGLNLKLNNMKSAYAEVIVTNLVGHVLHTNKGVSTDTNYVIPIAKTEVQMYLISVITPELTTTVKVVR